MDFKIPLVGKGVTLTEIPDHIAVFFEIGGCRQKCYNCHSPYHQTQGVMTRLSALAAYAKKQKEQGATAIVLMGGTTSKYLTKEELSEVINRLSSILPIGLYSGADVDDFFMSNESLSWYKAGAYVDTLGGLTSAATNQRFYQRKCGKWEIRNDLFQTRKSQEKHMDL